MELRGRTVLVTGASRGIGEATALAMGRRGARVGLLARSGGELEALAERFRGPVAFATADVGDREGVGAAVASIVAELGEPDVLVNNAGIGAYAAVLEESPETFERLVRVNYLGTVNATLAVLPGMARRGRGVVVNVASVAGRVGAPFEAAYSASKFAVVGFSEALDAEMAGLGVQVRLVDPGPVSTSFTDARGVPFQRGVPRPLRPDRVARAVVAAVEGRRFEQVLPRWLRVAEVTRALAPGVFRRGVRRDARRESADLAARVRAWAEEEGGR